jgi:hypothetical protein
LIFAISRLSGLADRDAAGARDAIAGRVAERPQGRRPSSIAVNTGSTAARVAGRSSAVANQQGRLDQRREHQVRGRLGVGLPQLARLHRGADGIADDAQAKLLDSLPPPLPAQHRATLQQSNPLQLAVRR